MAIKVSIVTSDSRHKNLIDKLAFANGLCCLSIHNTAEDALQKIPKLKPDVLLVDTKLPCMDGFECVNRLTSRMPALPTLMLTADEGYKSELVFGSVHVGANGCLPASLPATEWVKSIKNIYSGAQRGHWKVLMLFSSDQRLSQAARHWSKMATLIGARATSIRYGSKWRKVVITGKGLKSRRVKSNPPERAMVEESRKFYI